MKTLICQQPGVMEYVEKDIPTPADNEVLLKIKAVGICGCIDSLEVRKKPGGHWIIRDLIGLDLVGLASL